MALSYSARSAADPETAWRLVSEPRLWHRWAPHVLGAVGLGRPQVRAGARGAAVVLGVGLVPARVISVEPGRSWEWRAGPLRVDHRVAPLAGGGCEVGIELAAPRPLEVVLAASYGPLTGLIMRRLARMAEREGPAAGRGPAAERGR